MFIFTYLLTRKLELFWIGEAAIWFDGRERAAIDCAIRIIQVVQAKIEREEGKKIW